VSSPLSGIAAAKRRQLAATLGLFAMLFVAVGAVAGTGATTTLMKVFVAVSLAVALLLALVAYGVLRSVRLDAAERRLDAALEEAVRAGGGRMCDCGHDHDPDELHFVDGEGQHLTGRPAATCAHDGHGEDCTHSCETCVLAALRDPANERPVPAARRPQPGPRRPSPVARR
jgi:hypothetical protein